MSGAHADGVWLDQSGNVLGYGCADGTDCPTCFTQIDDSASPPQYVSYEELDEDLDKLIGDDQSSDPGQHDGQAAEDADDRARERVA